MSEDLAVALDPTHQAVASWLALGSMPGKPEVKAKDLAEELGIDKSTIYRIAQKPQVKLAASRMVADNLQCNDVPRIFRGIMTEAETDPKFGLQVLKWLQTLGISPVSLVIAKKEREEKDKPPVQVNINMPGAFESRIRAVREGDDFVDVNIDEE